MSEDKEMARKNSVKKAYLKTIGVLERICSDCQVSYAESFPQYTPDLVDTASENVIQKKTYELKTAVVDLIKTFYVDRWITIAKKAYDDKELRELISTLTLMIEMEPVYSYEHFMKLFELMNGLNSEKEEEVMTTLLKIRDSAVELSTEEIINSYTELTRTKYKDGVVYAIIDGMKKGPNKKHAPFIACYFNDKSLIASEKTLN